MEDPSSERSDPTRLDTWQAELDELETCDSMRFGGEFPSPNKSEGRRGKLSSLDRRFVDSTRFALLCFLTGLDRYAAAADRTFSENVGTGFVLYARQ